MKKSLLIIHDSLGGGGAERVLITILENLDRAKFEISLLLIYGEGVHMQKLPADIEVMTLFGSYGDLITRLQTHFYSVRNYIRKRKAGKLLGTRKWDVAVSFMEGPVAKLHSQLFSFAKHNYSWVHCNLELGRWYSFWLKSKEERELYRRMERIAFVSQGAMDAFEKKFDSGAQKVVIANPVDRAGIIKAGSEQLPSDFSGDRNVFKIVNVGRLIDDKRQDRLIRVARILKEKGYSFRIDILGSGPLESELKNLAEVLQVGDKVNFLGYKDNPHPYMKNADLFCLTSATEGFGMVVAESLCLSTPVVSTCVNGVTDMLAEGGGVLTGDNEEDIAEKIMELIDSPDRYRQICNGTETAAQRFDIETVMNRITSFLYD